MQSALRGIAVRADHDLVRRIRFRTIAILSIALDLLFNSRSHTHFCQIFLNRSSIAFMYVAPRTMFEQKSESANRVSPWPVRSGQCAWPIAILSRLSHY